MQAGGVVDVGMAEVDYGELVSLQFEAVASENIGADELGG